MNENEHRPDIADGELVRAAKSGDTGAFGELYRRYLDPIYRFIRSRVSTETDAEDITEMVFLKAFEALDRYEERGAPFGAFLYQVARNTLVDYYRSAEPLEALDAADTHSDSSPDAEKRVIDRESVSKVEAALASLPEHYQEVIRLRLMMDLPTDQVAAWMNRKPNSVRVLQHRALKALRDALGVNDEE